MAKETKINYTDNDRAIVATLKGSAEGMTLAEINEAAGLKLVPGHIVSAMKKGLIAKVGERDIEKPSTRKVFTYSFATAEPMNKEDGKPHNYTDSEREILAAAANIDSPFTLQQLSEAVGRKLSSGSINGLIMKGNLAKGDQIAVACMSKATVSVYAFSRDIPDAE